MTAPTTMQIRGFRGNVITPDQDGYDDARASRSPYAAAATTSRASRCLTTES